MNLLHVVHYPVFGGPHNQALRLTQPLMQRGWNTLMLVPEETGNALPRLREGGVETMALPLHRLRASPNPRVQAKQLPYLWGDVKRIRAVIRDQKTNVVLISGLVNPQAAFAARSEGAAVVWQLLDTRAPAPVRKLSMQFVTRMADVIMSTGMSTARIHEGAMRFGNRLISFFPPVDTSAFRPNQADRAAVRAEWGVAGNDYVLGAVSNINPQKGIENLIDAVAHARHLAPERSIKLVLAGAEYDTHRAYSEALRAQMKRLGLTEGRDVLFLGARSDVARQLQGFDTFVMGSVPNSEGIPTVILEAMSTGLPVVATDVGSVAEAVDNGRTGYVVPPLQPEALANAAVKIMRDDYLRRGMSLAGREKAVAQFDVEACTNTHIRAFEVALAHRRATHPVMDSARAA